MQSIARKLIHYISFIETSKYAPVAQLDRVTGFEPVGREFESLQARQSNPKMGTDLSIVDILIATTEFKISSWLPVMVDFILLAH